MTRSAPTDGDWVGITLDDAVIYGLHIGVFTGAGTFDAAASQLPRLCDLGVTTLEVLSDVGLIPFAVTESYGGIDGLSRFVDASHAVGLGVVSEVDCNHLGSAGLTEGHFIENAVGWIRDLRLDGLHLDGAELEASFVRELTKAVHAEAHQSGRTALVTIGRSANDPRILRSVAEDGWGCDAICDREMRDALQAVLVGQRNQDSGVDDLAAAWNLRPGDTDKHASVFDVNRLQFIVSGTTHDRAGDIAVDARLLAEVDAFDPRHRLAAAAILLSPFTPWLYMGEEYGGPTIADGEPHRSLFALYTELLRLRRHHQVLTAADVPQEVSVDDTVMTVTRWGSHATVTICFNFSDEPVGREAEGEVVFDTDDHSWGGPGRRRDIVGPWSARLELAP